MLDGLRPGELTGLDRLDDLLDRFRATGVIVEVSVTVHGEPAVGPPMADHLAPTGSCRRR